MNRLRWIGAGLAAAAVFWMSSAAPARVKLVTLPDRDKMVLSLEHHDATLVQEERILALQKGTNYVDFNWQGVSIDENAIILEPLEHPAEIRLIAVRYPPGENALVWEIWSPRAMNERVRVSYFLHGVGREIAYRAIADNVEANLSLKQYLRLNNRSGEQLENVEIHTGFSSPYTTDLDQGEVRQRLLHTDVLPIVREFTWQQGQQPDDPEKSATTPGIPIRYVIVNDAEHGLGEYSLRNGKARIFIEDAEKQATFLGEDWGTYTPVAEDMKLKVGESRDIKVTRKTKSIDRMNERKNIRNQPVLWDQLEKYEMTIENFRDREVTVTARVNFDQTWDVRDATHPYERVDYRTLEFLVPVAAADSEVISYTVERRNLAARSVLE